MLTFILVIILISLLIRMLVPYLLPRLMRFWIRKQQKRHQAWQDQNQHSEGSVKINYQPPGENRAKPLSREGEYVDFEEIEDK